MGVINTAMANIQPTRVALKSEVDELREELNKLKGRRMYHGGWKNHYYRFKK